MSLLELFITAVALAMDAFAVAICKGLTVEKVKLRHAVITGVWFGGFQMLMPLLGYLCASMFSEYITNFDHWVAFFLLVAIGISMIAEAFKKDEEKERDKSLFLYDHAYNGGRNQRGRFGGGHNLCLSGRKHLGGHGAHRRYYFHSVGSGRQGGQRLRRGQKNIAEIAGGVILILLGVKILLQHLGVINF